MLAGSDIEVRAKRDPATAESEPHGNQASIQRTRTGAVVTKISGDWPMDVLF